jgi:amidase
VVGLKPTRGRVSRAGVFPLGGSLDHIGPLARTVRDAAIVIDAISGQDPDDATTLNDPHTNCLATSDQGAKDVRIGVDLTYATDGVEPAVAEAFRRDLRRLESVGVTLVDVRVPPVEEVMAVWAVLCAAEAVVHHKGLWPERASSYGPTFRTFLEYGARVTGADVANAWLVREEWSGRFANAVEDVDAIACPSMTTLPFPVAALPPHAEFAPGVSTLLRFTAPFDFNGWPTLSIPSGFSTDGLPESLQLVGKPRSESLLCRVGCAFEGTDTSPRRRPPHA